MVSPIICFLLIFWYARNVKYILFWIYFWQLKQYHRGRAWDHLKSEKGKQILFGKAQQAKFVLLAAFIIGLFLSLEYQALLILLLFFVYFAETLLYFKSIFAKRVKNPAFTKKTLFLTAVALLAMAIYPFFIFAVTDIFWYSFLILLFDMLLPAIVSLIVMIFQPLADKWRLDLQKKAKEKIDGLKWKLKIIGITGSYGKTSAKEFLDVILSEKFKVLCTKDHQNTEVAIPQVILKELDSEHEVLILEMGAYDKDTIKRICDFAQPNIGIVTGVNSQHLALFGSMENLLSAEGGQELLECLPKEGFIIVNGENKYCRDLYKKAKIKKISYSYKDVENIVVGKDFVSFRFQGEHFRVNGYGKHSILNLLAAITCAKELGMKTSEIAAAAKIISHKQSPFRMNKKENGQVIINATYSSNPDGAFADLEYLEIYPGKKAIVMPCLIELGDTAKEVHKQIARKIAEVCDLAIITTPDFYNEMKAEAMLAGMEEENILNITDGKIISEKINSLGANSAVLLEGRLSGEIIDKLK